MTAEIAILNKEAVAMAADSAVTFKGSENEDPKIFFSANKIFSLSKYHPVGIMIYGAASFMQVPWETIIKSYRSKLDSQDFNTLEEYANDFVAFFCKKNSLFPVKQQQAFMEKYIYSYFRDIIQKQIIQKVEALFKDGLKPSNADIKKILNDTVLAHYEIWERADSQERMTHESKEKLRQRVKPIVNRAIKDVFERLPINRSLHGKLEAISLNLFLKFPENLVTQENSGVVISGFGRRDIFPKLKEFVFEGIALNSLKFKTANDLEITFESDAAILPFAQTEMVATFMTGINPDYQSALTSDIAEILKVYPGLIIDNIKELDNQQRESYKGKVTEMSDQKLKEYINALQDFQRKKFINPILNIVSVLTKTELAGMAESLVNLTSFKRKVSTDAETVGGPIDVAIISKGDGLVWIKRKHYFRPELNAQFFHNYNRIS